MISYRPKLFAEGNWILPTLLFIVAGLGLSGGIEKTSIILSGVFVAGAVLFIVLLVAGTRIKLSEGNMIYHHLLFQRKYIPIRSISKITWRSKFTSSKKRFPQFNIYGEGEKYAFTINPKPYSKRQFIELTKALLEINPRIDLDENLIKLSKALDEEAEK